MSEFRFRRVAHVCRTCLGPVLEGADGKFTCAVCDAMGETPQQICGCGLHVSGSTARALGFRCTANPARGPSSPAGTVIVFGTPDGRDTQNSAASTTVGD
jgi:hypothetical protein